jgi:hypothetical protein
MLREHAWSIGNKVAEQNLTTIKRALSIVLSRGNLGRQQRANTVGGAVVPETSENAENGDYVTAVGQPRIATAAPAGVVLFVRPAMKIHPVADLFPLIAGPEFDGLVEKIHAHGLRDPITTWKGMLLDGPNRRRACEAAGIIPQFQELELADGQQAIEYIISANLHRHRHDLSAGQAERRGHS